MTRWRLSTDSISPGANPKPPLLIAALREPALVRALTPGQWTRLIGAARGSDLLGRLAHAIDARNELRDVPDGPRLHLESALVVSGAQESSVRREIGHVSRALAEAGVVPIALKGTAYLMRGLPTARGRMFSDLDILVPRDRLTDVEGALMMHGWATTHHNAYDQRYYRRWMHELPPMRHVTRGTVLDVHHNILPSTARHTPDASLLIAASEPVAMGEPLRTLSPEDMVLHSATHLFVNDDLTHGLRDLADLDSLLRHFGADAAFWPRLVTRARMLHLARYIHYALRYTRLLFGTPMPEEVEKTLAPFGPPWPLRGAMDRIYMAAFTGFDPGSRGRIAVSTKCLYVRGHWLRMPPWLLMYHLSVKALRRQEEAVL